jgi:hypothetical protein
MLARLLREIAFAETGVQHIVPIREHLQIDVILCQIVSALMLI